jgi:hypothetical protein
MKKKKIIKRQEAYQPLTDTPSGENIFTEKKRRASRAVVGSQTINLNSNA